MKDDDYYSIGVRAGYENTKRMLDAGLDYAEAERASREAIDTYSRPGSDLHLGALFGAQAAIWERMGWQDGWQGERRHTPPEDLAEAYWVGYRAGLARRREQLSAQKKMDSARGQGGPGVQLRLIEGGKKGAM